MVDLLEDVNVHGGDTPTVLVGDLNLSDRQALYRDIAAEWRDVMRSGDVGPTGLGLVTRPLLLRIDHLFTSHDLCSTDPRRLHLPGSDHRGLMARIGPCP